MSSVSDVALVSNQSSISLEVPKPSDPNFDQIMSLYLKRMTDSINTKEGSFYPLEEILNFKQYFDINDTQVTRNVFRKTFDFVDLNGGPIAGGATVFFPHGILDSSGNVDISDTAIIYAGCTTAEPRFFSVMYPNVYILGTDIYFVNPLPATAVTKCNVVAEYLKN